MGRTAEAHGVGDFRDGLVRMLRRAQQIVASLQSPEPQPFRGRYVHEPEEVMEVAHRYSIVARNRGQRQVWIPEIGFNIRFDRAEARALDALIVG